MKTISAALLAYLNSVRGTDATFKSGDIYTLTLSSGSIAGIASGQALYYTNLDIPVVWNSNTFLANSVMFDGLKYKAATGIGVDEQTLTVSATSDMTIGGIPWLQAIQLGVFDGAEIQRERAYFSAWGQAPIGTILLFKGRVTEVTQVDRTGAQLKVASDLTLLNIEMPHRMYSQNCNNVLYGPICGVSKAAHTTSGTVQTGSTRSRIVWSGATSNHQNGTLLFTSGYNSGVSVTVKYVASPNMSLVYPLPSPVAIGDTFSAFDGCDHTIATCTSNFSNASNFRGFPYIPPPQIITGPLSSQVTSK
jgi:uncharacterized phage protein (TIGR02218 family)